MKKAFFWISLAAVAASFAGGFLLANALNRSELAALRTENSRLSSEAANSNTEPGSTLSNEEIRKKIAEADANPTNFSFQKNLGLALYQYGSMKQDTDLIKESIRLLARAGDLKKDDVDLVTAQGNAFFDIGLFEKDNSSFDKAREFYSRSLALHPNDAPVTTDIGLTYFLYQPPNYDNAAEEFLKALKADPKYEKALQFLIQTLAKQNKPEEAKKYLEQLRNVNPENEALQGLSDEVVKAQAQAGK